MAGATSRGPPPSTAVKDRLPRRVLVLAGTAELACARRLSELSQASWVYTGTSAQTGYATRLFESHGLNAPPVGAMVNSTLALLALLGSGDQLGLMPEQIIAHQHRTEPDGASALRQGGPSGVLTIGFGVRTLQDEGKPKTQKPWSSFSMASRLLYIASHGLQNTLQLFAHMGAQCVRRYAGRLVP
jgi:DNA-binding transcriptional LysR family regulator